MLEWARRNPRPVVLVAAAVLLIVAFFVIVAPLFRSSSAPTAEIAGTLPTSAVAGKQFEIDVGVDNTGFSSISPICISAQVQGALRADYAVFQDVDRRVFAGGSACGGALNGQATISVRLFFTALSTGRAALTLTPSQNATALGTGLSGAIAVAAAP